MASDARTQAASLTDAAAVAAGSGARSPDTVLSSLQTNLMRRPQHYLYHRPGSPPPPHTVGGPEGIILAGVGGSNSSSNNGRPAAWVRYLRARLLGGSAAGAEGIMAPGSSAAASNGSSGGSSSGWRHRVYVLLALMMVGMVVLRVARHSMESAYRAEVDSRPPGAYGDSYTIRCVAFDGGRVHEWIGRSTRDFPFTTQFLLHTPRARRVNTFRRNDLLKGFLYHFAACPRVAQIQVVWSDQENAPPPIESFGLPSAALAAKVAFERQPTDSLNNRFRALLPVPTPAVLSLDDDLEIPCAQLDFAHRVWQASPRSLVGFTPRLATWDPSTGAYRYQSSFTMVWWHGLYNIVLTKCCFLHRDYLGAYFEALSPETLRYIDERRNCEDLAMQFVVSNATAGAPPVWVRAGRFTDRGVKIGISQGKDHERERSDCLNHLAREFGHFPLTPTSHKAVDARRQWFW